MRSLTPSIIVLTGVAVMLLCSRGAFSPISQSSAGGHKRASPQRRGPHGGGQVQGSLLEYSEFTAGDNTSVGSGLGMDDILGRAHVSNISLLV
jgi:hypothetical protein